MTRDAALSILCEHVRDAGLRRHCVAVEAGMRGYAERLNGDPEQWGLAGLLHDFDWEIHPTLEDHPLKGAEILRRRGADEVVVRAILSHNTAYTGVERTDPIDFALSACDEITGLLIAVALVRPGKNIGDVAIKSVKKKWKDRSFAAGVDRDHVEIALADFSAACFNGALDLWTHTEHVLESMRLAAAALELDGRLAVSDRERP